MREFDLHLVQVSCCLVESVYQSLFFNLWLCSVVLLEIPGLLQSVHPWSGLHYPRDKWLSTAFGFACVYQPDSDLLFKRWTVLSTFWTTQTIEPHFHWKVAGWWQVACELGSEWMTSLSAWHFFSTESSCKWSQANENVLYSFLPLPKLNKDWTHFIPYFSCCVRRHVTQSFISWMFAESVDFVTSTCLNPWTWYRHLWFQCIDNGHNLQALHFAIQLAKYVTDDKQSSHVTEVWTMWFTNGTELSGCGVHLTRIIVSYV